MIGRWKFAGEVDDHRLILTGRESDVPDRGAPLSVRVAHLERRRRQLDRRLLRERDVDARIGGINPAAQEKVGAGATCGFAEVHFQIVGLHHALILGRREVGEVHIVALAQRGQHIVTALVGR